MSLTTAALPNVAAAATPVEPSAAKAWPAQGLKIQLHNKARVSRGRPDDVAGRLHKTFNYPTVLPPFDAEVYGAKFDVEPHRITSYTQVLETCETLKVSGLLALPLGVQGPLPVVSWLHGIPLSCDQVPSNLMRISDPA